MVEATQSESIATAGSDPRGVIVRRRLISIGTILAAALLAIVTAPLWIPAAWLVDRLSSGRRCTLRCGVFLCFYLYCEIAGLARLALATARAWLADELGTDADRDRLVRLQGWWGSSLLRGAARIFGFEISASGEEALDAGPMILMVRHASTADTVLASDFVSRQHGIRLRYVLKHELLWDPCLDIVGNRTINYFVKRGSGDPAVEVEGIRSLLEGLDDSAAAPGIAAGHGILIYPEGTRFSPEKRARALERLASQGETHVRARAARLEHTLPPRLSGTLALLQENPGRDVVVCAHSGFEGAASFWDLWNGALQGAVVRIHFKRIPHASIPRSRKALIDWLFDEWEEVDDYVGRRGLPAAGPEAPGASV